MIRKEDLRIGSMVYAHDQSWIVKVIDPIRGCIIAYGETDLDEKCNYIKIRETVLSGIPITEEKLINDLGFKKQRFGIGGQDTWAGMDFYFKDEITLRGNVKKDGTLVLKLAGYFNSNIKYIHQLQNIVHSLSGEELKFKDK